MVHWSWCPKSSSYPFYHFLLYVHVPLWWLSTSAEVKFVVLFLTNAKTYVLKINGFTKLWWKYGIHVIFCRDFLQSLDAFHKINLVDNQVFVRISSWCLSLLSVSCSVKNSGSNFGISRRSFWECKDDIQWRTRTNHPTADRCTCPEACCHVLLGIAKREKATSGR